MTKRNKEQVSIAQPLFALRIIRGTNLGIVLSCTEAVSLDQIKIDVSIDKNLKPSSGQLKSNTEEEASSSELAKSNAAALRPDPIETK